MQKHTPYATDYRTDKGGTIHLLIHHQRGSDSPFVVLYADEYTLNGVKYDFRTWIAKTREEASSDHVRPCGTWFATGGRFDVKRTNWIYDGDPTQKAYHFWFRITEEVCAWLDTPEAAEALAQGMRAGDAMEAEYLADQRAEMVRKLAELDARAAVVTSR